MTRGRSQGDFSEMFQAGSLDDRQTKFDLHRSPLFRNMHQADVGAFQCRRRVRTISSDGMPAKAALARSTLKTRT